MAVYQLMLVFWIVTPCGLVMGTNVLEEQTASIFTIEECLEVDGLYRVRMTRPGN
jgi:hypothetical protein